MWKMLFLVLYITFDIKSVSKRAHSYFCLFETHGQVQNVIEGNENDDDDWEYIEEGPAEIIWQGNEIIVKKNKVRVPKKDILGQSRIEVSSIYLVLLLFSYHLISCLLTNNLICE